ncbi:LegC family aminotransferase [Thermodesulfobacteriota bacterium]
MNNKSIKANKVLQIIKHVLRTEREEIQLHEPSFTGNEWNYMKDCLDSTFVSSVGEYVDRFEAMLSDYTGLKKAVAVVNGTSALHIALKLVGVERTDEVLIPALTFVATANAVSYLGAVPHLIDCEERTLGIDPIKLNEYLDRNTELRDGQCYNVHTKRRIRAVVPVHIFGHPVDLDSLWELCRRFHLEMVEDATESLGSFYKEKHTGHWGECSVISFNGNKIITTGGGGAILTNNEELANTAKHLTTTAKVSHKWEFYHDQIGYNYRMPNINATLGCAQLEQLAPFLKRKRDLANKYAQAFENLESIRFFVEPEFARSNYWLNAILTEDGLTTRDAILEITNKNGVMTRPVWTPMHKLPMYQNSPKMDLSVTDNLATRLINIPSSPYHNLL